MIAPDAAWFMDPARAFPVTVDPTYVSGTTKARFDTWIRSGVTTDQSASTDLQVGYDGVVLGAVVPELHHRPVRGQGHLVGQHLAVAALLAVVHADVDVGAFFDPGDDGLPLDQPAGTRRRPTGRCPSAKGFSGACPGGRITVPMTGLAQAWSTASYPVGGMALTATNEQDATTYKKFYSTAGIADPYITMTWNRPPATPAAPTFVSAVAYAPPGGTSALYSPYLDPWVSTKATDADGNTVQVHLRVPQLHHGRREQS